MNAAEARKIAKAVNERASDQVVQQRRYVMSKIYGAACAGKHSVLIVSDMIPKDRFLELLEDGYRVTITPDGGAHVSWGPE